ncbi:hypothetical protein CIK68_06195 [Brachybacterium alimentarium]|nr:hypothetical protein CIK68_06195 [Brachybacterium alimentarium]
MIVGAARILPERAGQVCATGSHRALGRVVRDAVLLLLPGHPNHGTPDGSLVEAAMGAVEQLRALQSPSGTFRGGDNVDSPPDTAFTINDLAWALAAITRLSGDEVAALRLAPLLARLERVLTAATPALVGGGVHTPNHRWEIASALARMWETLGSEVTRERALQWLNEGADLQADGLFSERSANYAAHVSVPALLTLGRALERPDLIRAADLATRTQAELTDDHGLVESLASRRQDQFAPFDGGALHPWFRAHAARTGDRITARAAERTSGRADADALLTLLALGAEDPSALAPLPAPAPSPTPDAPDVIELDDSGLVRIDHGSSSAVLFGGTDTAMIGRVASGTSSRPVLTRFRGAELGMRELRLSRDFFSVGPLRPESPRPLDSARTRSDGTDAGHSSGALRYLLEEQVSAEYFQPLAPADHDPEGRYSLEFNGRFAAAMDFSRRPVETVALRTSMLATVEADGVELHWTFQGPETPVCLLLALDGGDLGPGLPVDEHGRRILEPGADAATEARCTLRGQGERLEIAAAGQLGGRAFYDPGEAYSFLGASDEPGGDVLLIPASTATPLTLRLRLEGARTN